MRRGSTLFIILMTSLILCSNIAYADSVNVEKQSPRIRVLPLTNQPTTLSMQTIGPFLNHSKVLTKHMALTSPSIVSMEETRVVAGKGDKVYFKAAKPKSINMGDAFYVLRKGKTYQHPSSQALLGYEYILIGEGRVVSRSANKLGFLLTKSLQQIQIGDQLLAVGNEPRPQDLILRTPANEAKGQIISVWDGVTHLGQYSVVTLTGGKDMARNIGDTLAIYGQNHIEDIGRLVVFNVFDKVSFGLVLHAEKPLHLLDKVGRP